MIDDIVQRLDVLNVTPASAVLARLAQAVAAGGALGTDELVALAFVAGVEVGTLGSAGRAEVALAVDAFQRTARGTLLDTGRAYADRAINDLIAEAQADRD